MIVACVASVSVWFRSKEKPRNGILGFGRARNERRAKKWKWGGGGGEGRKRLHIDPSILKTRVRQRSSDSLMFHHKPLPRVTKYKKYILGWHMRPLKFISAPLKAKHFIGQLWQLMTASNVGAQTQAWQAKWAVFKIPGLSASVSFLSSPPPPRSITYAIFHAFFDFRSSFFAPKPHGNACYLG